MVKRNHTRSRSFKLSGLWGVNSNSSDDKPTAPATPGAFNYYSVADPGAARQYQEYAQRQQQQQQQGVALHK